MKYTHCINCTKEKCNSTSKLCKSCAFKGKKLGPQSEEHRRKLSGPKTLEHRRKISICQGGNGKLEERKYPGIRRWTRLIKERDGKCITCGSVERLEAHHILPKATYPQFATWTINGITLCKRCHRGANGVH